MHRIAIIPVKRRSRRLPEKNLRNFKGKPMFMHTVAAALESGLFDRVVVSTSDDEAISIAEGAGIDVHGRDTSLDQDSARLVDVCLAVLEEEQKAGREYDLMVLLLATAPMRHDGDIAGVVELAERFESGGVMAVTTYAHPPHEAFRAGEDGTLTPMFPELVDLRAEQLPALFVDNGSTYALHVKTFLAERNLYPSELRAYEMPRRRSVDLDDDEDLALLEYYYRQEQDG